MRKHFGQAAINIINDSNQYVNMTTNTQSKALTKLHPAAEWAMEQTFSTLEVDCTTTVVLKILDGKCKMLPGEKAAIFEIYDVVKHKTVGIFSDSDIASIETARRDPNDSETLRRIHALRVYGEEKIPKVQMKQYKARLRDGLFG